MTKNNPIPFLVEKKKKTNFLTNTSGGLDKFFVAAIHRNLIRDVNLRFRIDPKLVPLSSFLVMVFQR